MIGLLASFLFFAHGERQKNLFSKIVDCFPPDFVEMLYLAIIRNFKKRKMILINIFIQSLLVYMALYADVADTVGGNGIRGSIL